MPLLFTLFMLKNFQLFLEQLEDVLQGSEPSIRLMVLSLLSFYARFFSSCNAISFIPTYCCSRQKCQLTTSMYIYWPFFSLEELVTRSRDQSVSDYGERICGYCREKCL